MRTPRGFTLIEVMVALALFAVGALAAVQLASETTRSASILEDRYFASLVASNRMAEVHAQARWNTWPPRDEASGQVELANRTWYWQQQVVATVTEDLQEVTIRVSLSDNGPVVAEVSGFVGRR
ncbi:type II secretion system protein GspI [Aliidiomarina halalkaliphila]|uniref:Type II secretion system protein I n=1 Tax=Aliidiomarina halalkaliphila TaxID=2593535 RepID=A0A552X5M0_9GAMM|nr:type II secretion system minor pseudopilin GspI [Aliidiomarina halalkaliphila]TRW50311.1 type II secretion system protein GspI [Aliidiomarina halalkaliphila]